MRLRLQLCALSLLLLSAVGCAVGPKYQRATVPNAAAWSVEPPWREAAPRDAIPKGAWWTIYGDDPLNQYEQQAIANNQTVQIAVQRLEQSRALVRNTQSGLFPSLSGGVAADRQRL